MLPHEEEVKIGPNTYIFNSQDETLRRYNERSKMWVRIIFVGGNGLEKLKERLVEEYIRQCIEKLDQGSTGI
ncbi:hypothetical protein J41TS12_50150 [Paenibacillus antibioticophila]|uniref:Uncharacterized protein n=1 Tax=Paenibacillus antibioticophila TaxID=1274374 RepID=A0A919XY23_9BACL|nr:hypothetical protein [Paenibacillus antibioticophila]GIO40154.1 hypothetical protein J41TS12_50150 [Paenibacillus antibioticophila]